jgi:hypothetical protein
VVLATWRKRRNAQRKREEGFAIAELGEDGVPRPELLGDEMRHEMEAKHGTGELGDPSEEGSRERERRREEEKKVHEMPG